MKASSFFDEWNLIGFLKLIRDFSTTCHQFKLHYCREFLAFTFSSVISSDVMQTNSLRRFYRGDITWARCKNGKTFFTISHVFFIHFSSEKTLLSSAWGCQKSLSNAFFQSLLRAFIHIVCQHIHDIINICVYIVRPCQGSKLEYNSLTHFYTCYRWQDNFSFVKKRLTVVNVKGFQSIMTHVHENCKKYFHIFWRSYCSWNDSGHVFGLLFNAQNRLKYYSWK